MVLRAIAINKEIYNKPVDAPEEIKKMGKVKINLFIPPTDIPNFVVAEADKKADTFKIKFNYTVQEKGEYLFNNNQVSFLIGEQSGKPLVIEVKRVEKDTINEISLTNFIRHNLEELLSKHISKIQSLRQRTNIELTREFLQNQISDLVGAVA